MEDRVDVLVKHFRTKFTYSSGQRQLDGVHCHFHRTVTILYITQLLQFNSEVVTQLFLNVFLSEHSFSREDLTEKGYFAMYNGPPF